MTILSKQPFKGIYVLFAMGATLAQMPIWVLKYIFQSGRQHPTWTFRQAFGERFMLAFLHHSAVVQVDGKLTLNPGKEKDRFITIDPAKASYYIGPLTSNDDVKPATIGATWYPSPLSKKADLSTETIVLHMHGGAFVIGDGRAEASGHAAKLLLKHTSATHILKPQYRLSTLPASKTSNPFPAALQDTVTAYVYLVHDLQVPPTNIIISGDSAGGNLAIALTRYLAEYGAQLKLPNPAACWLFSPWISPMLSTSEATVVARPQFHIDYLPLSFINWGTAAYSGLKGYSVLSNPYIEALGTSFETRVPIWANSGEAELLYSDIKKFTDEMGAVEGNRVVLDIEEAAPHDVVLVGNINGFEVAGENTARRAGDWWEGVRKGVSS
ncbi:alpha/beta-hydrolase [Lophium mytilinum]|uniref:Alpha/beta-hydrolase n=1 Tax=Lophium mytilinum TaxID=390894 RepID=A0A6A6QRT2_9PEZI|nr:alpha/beta-hydrolase [Lophium mytilinum]